MMPIDAVWLRQYTDLSCLSAEALEALSAQLHHRTIVAEQVFIRQDQAVEGLFILQKGRAELYSRCNWSAQ